MIKGAIFDLDGTLLDSMSVWDTVAEDYLRSLGIEPKENLNEVFKTFSLEQSANYYREHYGVTLSTEEITEGINATVRNSYITTVPSKPCVFDFLCKLKEHGVQMCVATVTDMAMAEAALKRCGLREYFSAILTCSSVGYSKEEPHIYRAALEQLKTKKSETLVFEDSFHALKTAKADGFISVAVYDEHEENQAELKSLADYYLNDYSDFEKFWHDINK